MVVGLSSLPSQSREGPASDRASGAPGDLLI